MIPCVAPWMAQYNVARTEVGMSSKAGLMIGVITTLVFLVIGGSLVAGQQTTFGGICLALAVFRFFGVLRQWRALSAADDEDA